jgi:hypothetical protein
MSAAENWAADNDEGQGVTIRCAAGKRGLAQTGGQRENKAEDDNQ